MALPIPSGQIRRFSCLAVILASLFGASAQESPELPVESESHHHLVLENAYVRVLYVEIPPHETTLRHHHDFPYVSVPPGIIGDDAAGPPAAALSPEPYLPHVAYAPGNFSHAVANPGDTPLRNVAVELLKPQGVVRNRCAAILASQPAENCEAASLHAADAFKRTALLESDEILVEAWKLAPGSTIAPANRDFDSLICGVAGVVAAGGSARAPDDPALWSRGGVLWLPAGSRMAFASGPGGGHFVAILFKDSRPLAGAE
jgi:hypothetical protein